MNFLRLIWIIGIIAVIVIIIIMLFIELENFNINYNDFDDEDVELAEDYSNIDLLDDEDDNLD